MLINVILDSVIKVVANMEDAAHYKWTGINLATRENPKDKGLRSVNDSMFDYWSNLKDTLDMLRSLNNNNVLTISLSTDSAFDLMIISNL